MKTILCLCLLLLLSVPAFAAGPGNTDLTWTNPATNDLGAKVERHEATCGTGTFVELTASAVAGHATAAKDLTTLAGHDYCFRVRLWNNSKLDGTGVVQYGPYSNESAVSYPLGAPNAAPTGLTAN